MAVQLMKACTTHISKKCLLQRLLLKVDTEAVTVGHLANSVRVHNSHNLAVRDNNQIVVTNLVNRVTGRHEEIIRQEKKTPASHRLLSHRLNRNNEFQ